MRATLQTKPKTSSSAAPAFTPVRGGLLQRKCACGGTTGPTGECEECRKKKLQRRASDSSAPSSINHSPSSISEVPPIVHEVLRSPGQPLDSGTRAFMEPRFGHDFSRVRVHTDAKAGAAAGSVNAHAFAVGQDIVFGVGQFQLAGGRPHELLAHELVHTIQQGATRPLQKATLEMTAPGDNAEREAEAMATAVMRGHQFSLPRHEPLGVARQVTSLAAPTNLTTPEPTTTQQEDKGGPQVTLIPHKDAATVQVLVNGVPVYEVHFPNAQGAIKTESRWDPVKQQFVLKIAVTEGAQGAVSAGVSELGKMVPNAQIEVTNISLPNGLPVLVQQTKPEKVIRGLPRDPDLKQNYLSIQGTETDIQTSPSFSEQELPTSDSEEEESGGLWDSVGEWVHGGLDVVGFVPVFGEIADGINALIYLGEGRYAEAAISACAMIPIAGDLGKVGKWTVKGAKELAETGVEQGIKYGAKEITEGVLKTSDKELVQSLTEKEAKEIAKKELKEKIAKCLLIYETYKALGNCRSCKGTDTPTQRAIKITCLTAELAGRQSYLAMDCDDVLEGSIAKGSPKAKKNHQDRLAEVVTMLRDCATKPTGMAP